MEPPLEVRISMSLLRVILMLLYISRTNVQAGVLYPYGSTEGDSKASPPLDDHCYGPYNHPIAMFGSEFTKLYVCTNGLISLDKIYKGYPSMPFPLPKGNSFAPLICPFWADVDLTETGNLWIRETTDPALLQIASQAVRDAYKSAADSGFNATWMLVATWENVIPFGQQSNQNPNTFQVVIVSDGAETLTMFNYKMINWIVARRDIPTAQIGFDAGDGINFYATPSSQTPSVRNATYDSNFGVPGRMMFYLGTAGNASQGKQQIILPDIARPAASSATATSTVERTSRETPTELPSTATFTFEQTDVASSTSSAATTGTIWGSHSQRLSRGRPSDSTTRDTFTPQQTDVTSSTSSAATTGFVWRLSRGISEDSTTTVTHTPQQTDVGTPTSSAAPTGTIWGSHSQRVSRGRSSDSTTRDTFTPQQTVVASSTSSAATTDIVWRLSRGTSDDSTTTDTFTTSRKTSIHLARTSRKIQSSSGVMTTAYPSGEQETSTIQPTTQQRETKASKNKTTVKVVSYVLSAAVVTLAALAATIIVMYKKKKQQSLNLESLQTVITNSQSMGSESESQF